jgi:hypothetical protein
MGAHDEEVRGLTATERILKSRPLAREGGFFFISDTCFFLGIAYNI